MLNPKNKEDKMEKRDIRHTMPTNMTKGKNFMRRLKDLMVKDVPRGKDTLIMM